MHERHRVRAASAGGIPIERADIGAGAVEDKIAAGSGMRGGCDIGRGRQRRRATGGQPLAEA